MKDTTKWALYDFLVFAWIIITPVLIGLVTYLILIHS